jgi:predicted metal-binding transcription factor (methanogenesis marker protein 9)
VTYTEWRRKYAPPCGHREEYGFAQYSLKYVEEDMQYGNWGMLHTSVVWCLNRVYCCCRTSHAFRLYQEAMELVDLSDGNLRKVEQVMSYVLRELLRDRVASEDIPAIVQREVRAFVGRYMDFNAHMSRL